MFSLTLCKLVHLQICSQLTSGNGARLRHICPPSQARPDDISWLLHNRGSPAPTSQDFNWKALSQGPWGYTRSAGALLPHSPCMYALSPCHTQTYRGTHSYTPQHSGAAEATASVMPSAASNGLYACAPCESCRPGSLRPSPNSMSPLTPTRPAEGCLHLAPRAFCAHHASVDVSVFPTGLQPL